MKKSSTSSRRTPEQWAEIIEQLNSSPLLHKDFCAQVGVAPSSLYTWQKKLKIQKSSSQLTGFIPLHIKKDLTKKVSTTTQAIEICLANGRVIRLIGDNVDRKMLHTVISVAEDCNIC